MFSNLMDGLAVIILASLAIVCFAEREDWDNIDIIQVNTEPAHSTMMVYPDKRTSVKDDISASPWYKLLNGQWKFHCLRNTSLTNWFANGMSEHDVMTLAGHSSFSTTHTFYLAVADDLVERARKAAETSLNPDLLRTCCAPHFAQEDKKAYNRNRL